MQDILSEGTGAVWMLGRSLADCVGARAVLAHGMFHILYPVFIGIILLQLIQCDTIAA